MKNLQSGIVIHDLEVCGLLHTNLITHKSLSHFIKSALRVIYTDYAEWYIKWPISLYTHTIQTPIIICENNFKYRLYNSNAFVKSLWDFRRSQWVLYHENNKKRGNSVSHVVNLNCVYKVLKWLANLEKQDTQPPGIIDWVVFFSLLVKWPRKHLQQNSLLM